MVDDVFDRRFPDFVYKFIAQQNANVHVECGFCGKPIDLDVCLVKSKESLVLREDGVYHELCYIHAIAVHQGLVFVDGQTVFLRPSGDDGHDSGKPSEADRYR